MACSLLGSAAWANSLGMHLLKARYSLYNTGKAKMVFTGVPLSTLRDVVRTSGARLDPPVIRYSYVPGAVADTVIVAKGEKSQVKKLIEAVRSQVKVTADFKQKIDEPTTKSEF